MTATMQQARTIGREIGTALAVLAIYLLTILAPLHQARATQLDFAKLGYETLESGWVLCTPAGAVDHSGKLVVSKCPAAGIGKDDLVEPSFDVTALAFDRSVLDAAAPRAMPAAVPEPALPPTGSRAPPIVA
jgi:hypothetical protein